MRGDVGIGGVTFGAICSHTGVRTGATPLALTARLFAHLWAEFCDNSASKRVPSFSYSCSTPLSAGRSRYWDPVFLPEDSPKRPAGPLGSDIVEIHLHHVFKCNSVNRGDTACKEVWTPSGPHVRYHIEVRRECHAPSCYTIEEVYISTSTSIFHTGV